jgi:endonuclease III
VKGVGRVGEWREVLRKSPDLKVQFLKEYHMLREIAKTAAHQNLCALRVCWEDVFTTRCKCAGKPCGACRDCDIRIAQAAIVVYAAQGVADENILPSLGAIFRSPCYRHFGAAEWSRVKPAELTTLLRHCSMQAQNALYIRDFLAEVAQNGVPRTLEDVLCFYGILKKSACLFLGVVFQEQYGIPVDRHLQAAFVNCGWVHPACKKGTDETLLSQMVELWLPMEDTGMINNVVAGLRQLYQKLEYRAKIMEVARQCGPAHQIMMRRIIADIDVDVGSASSTV